VLLMTVLVHFSKRSDYYEAMRRNIERYTAEVASKLVGVSDEIAAKHARRAGEHQGLRPPHRYNDVASFIEVIYDGDRTIKAYAYEAQARKRTDQLPRATRKDLKDRVYAETGKCSETWFQDQPTNGDFEQALYETRDQLSRWARRRRWSLEFDEALVESTNWALYVRLTQEGTSASHHKPCSYRETLDRNKTGGKKSSAS
jgi:hypothetical protein